MLVLDPDVNQSVDVFFRRVHPQRSRGKLCPELLQALKLAFSCPLLKVFLANLQRVAGFPDHAGQNDQLLLAPGAEMYRILQNTQRKTSKTEGRLITALAFRHRCRMLRIDTSA